MQVFSNLKSMEPDGMENTGIMENSNVYESTLQDKSTVDVEHIYQTVKEPKEPTVNLVQAKIRLYS